jgi:nucleoid-associated protein YgaU
MEFAVYVAMPPADDVDRIASAASNVAPKEFDFSILERDAPRERTGVELAFRIGGASSAEEARSKAVQIYALCRQEAGVPPDDTPQATVGVWPANR